MEEWSNIDVPKNDPEIILIDKIQNEMGELSSNIRKIRDLIRRFEVCHFKYQQHIEKIKGSILKLEPIIDPERIGSNHIKNGENAWKGDGTGRSLIGQRYIWALKRWIGEEAMEENLDDVIDDDFTVKVTNSLGEGSPDKERLIRLLIARLTWDWEQCEKMQSGKDNKELELQICQMDICHYAFPDNIDQLLYGIGEMKPIEKYEGCGSFDPDIKSNIENEYRILNDQLRSMAVEDVQDERDVERIWLISSFVKTMKEQIGLKDPIHGLDQF